LNCDCCPIVATEKGKKIDQKHVKSHENRDANGKQSHPDLGGECKQHSLDMADENNSLRDSKTEPYQSQEGGSRNDGSLDWRPEKHALRA
jgi:hypothetical protein